MNKESLESLMPLLAEMIMDGIEVKIKPTANEYPDMVFHVRDTDSYFFLHQKKTDFVVSSLIGRNPLRAENRENIFSALSLVLQGIWKSRIAEGLL